MPPPIREIRIQANDGKVVDADRDMTVTTRPGKGGPDKVKWVIVGGGGTFEVRFANASNDPFSAPITIAVPAGGSADQTVNGQPGTYKYSVFDNTGEMTDDPNIIIKS
jgi:hypothetical protein